MDTVHKCNVCHKEYKTERGLTNHKCKKTLPRVSPILYTCDDCNVTYKTLKGYDNHKCIKKEKSNIIYKCKYCCRVFKIKESYDKHNCIYKKRYELLGTRVMDDAIKMWKIFAEYNYLNVSRDHETFIDNFIHSNQFIIMYDFCEYINEINIIDKDGFIKYVIENVNNRYWKDPTHKHDWVIHYNKYDNPNDAIERSIVTMYEWSASTGYEWQLFYEYGSVERISMWLESGKLSPWFLYVLEDAEREKILSRFTEPELDKIYKFIERPYWKVQRKKFKDEVSLIRNVLREYNI